MLKATQIASNHFSFGIKLKFLFQVMWVNIYRDFFTQFTDLEGFVFAFYPVSAAHGTSIFLIYLLTVGCRIILTVILQRNFQGWD